jgi:XTP/dITP diphosphohydrolase
MKKTIVFASGNKGKLVELQNFFENSYFKIMPQSEFQVDDIPETALTFIENALLKARHAAAKSKCATLADDSGLVVRALNGAPGIYSARYAGTHRDSAANIQRVLGELKSTSKENRQAYFYCCLVLILHADDPTPLICEGIWHGEIDFQPSGSKGFGYDPIFFDTTYNCTASQLPLDVKNQISHRGQALKLLQTKLHIKMENNL